MGTESLASSTPRREVKVKAVGLWVDLRFQLRLSTVAGRDDEACTAARVVGGSRFSFDLIVAFACPDDRHTMRTRQGSLLLVFVLQDVLTTLVGGARRPASLVGLEVNS